MNIHNRARRWWGNINLHTINGKNAKLTRNTKSYFRAKIQVKCTKKEFYVWCLKQSRTINSLQARGFKPSLDRINSKDHYRIGNMRIISLRANCRQGSQHRLQNTEIYLSSLPERNCTECTKTLVRKRLHNHYRKYEQITAFLKRKFCSRKCNLVYQGKLRKLA